MKTTSAESEKKFGNIEDVARKHAKTLLHKRTSPKVPSEIGNNLKRLSRICATTSDLTARPLYQGMKICLA